MYKSTTQLGRRKERARRCVLLAFVVDIYNLIPLISYAMFATSLVVATPMEMKLIEDVAARQPAVCYIWQHVIFVFAVNLESD